MRICCGAFRTTPVHAILVELWKAPLALWRMKLLRQWVKLKSLAGGHPASVLPKFEDEPVHTARDETFIIGVEALWLPVPHWLILDTVVDFGVMEMLRSRGKEMTPQQAVEERLRSEWSSSLQVYTDGSRDPENGRVG